VEKTNAEIDVHLFDNANNHMIKKEQQGGKNQMIGRCKRLNLIMKGSFTQSL